MKIICNTQRLSEACQNVQRAVSTKAAIPSIEGILFQADNNRLSLAGYDLEVGITTVLEAKTEENGSVVLNARLLCDILRRLPEERVLIEVDEHQLCKIKSGDAEFSLIGLSADDFPELPSVTGGMPLFIKQGILKDMIRQTIFAVSKNDSKAVHKGIKFELSPNNLKLVAVDGFRLAIRNEVVEYAGEDISFVVPAKTLSEVIKLTDEDDENIALGVGKRHISFELGGYNIISRLLDGEFLDYKAAIPSVSSTVVIVNHKLLSQSIDRNSLMITDNTKSPVRCIFDDNIIKISSTTALGTSSDRIPASVEGTRIEIGFNSTYFLDALSACDTDEIKIEFSGPVSPIIIKPTDGDSFLFLVLPMRLKNEN